MSYDFNGTTKVITLSAGTTEFDAVDLYSRWKDWVAAGNAQFAFAFASVAGDPIGPGQTIAPYIFLNTTDGWRIRPDEADHELRVAGNLYSIDSTLPLFVSTIGDFSVIAIIERSSAAISVAVGGSIAPTQQQIRDAMKLAASGGAPVDGSVDLRLLELYRLMGLDPTKPLVVSSAARAAGAEINQTIVDAAGTVTVTRQP